LQADISLMPIKHSIGGKAEPVKPAERPLLRSLWRGFRLRCPNCGEGAMFGAYLKVNNACPHCGEELHHHRADDAPPYFTMLIVGHVIVGSVLAVEMAFAPPMWLQMIAWPILAVALCLLLLPCIKGTLVALQWALRMHGFDAAARANGTPFIDYDPMHPIAGDVRKR
jgi:uncharacterized protein (DUF983 family)